VTASTVEQDGSDQVPGVFSSNREDKIGSITGSFFLNRAWWRRGETAPLKRTQNHTAVLPS
jgi:hypothetical protein